MGNLANREILPHHFPCHIDGSRVIFYMRILFKGRIPREMAKCCVVGGPILLGFLIEVSTLPENVTYLFFKSLYKNRNIFIVDYTIIHGFYDHIFNDIQIFYSTSN